MKGLGCGRLTLLLPTVSQGFNFQVINLAALTTIRFSVKSHREQGGYFQLAHTEQRKTEESNKYWKMWFITGISNTYRQENP